MSQHLKIIEIATPYQADANNGNWRTAHRWQALLSREYQVIVQGDSRTAKADTSAKSELLIALHARRSADIIQQSRLTHPDKPIIVVLTGTDLYKDLPHDAEAQESLRTADALIVLQEDAIQHVPMPYRKKPMLFFNLQNRSLPQQNQQAN